MLGGAAVLFGSGLAVHSGISGLTQEEIALLDPMDLGSLDRTATNHYSAEAKYTSDALVAAGSLGAALWMTNHHMRKDALTIGVMGIETVGWTTGLAQLTKSLVSRIRPFVYNPAAHLADKQERDARYSFFSGHTSLTAALGTFSASIFSAYYPGSRWKPLVWTAALTLPALTGYMRFLAGKHFPTDIITGYAIGAAIGLLVPSLHKTRDYDTSWSVTLGPLGGSLAYAF